MRSAILPLAIVATALGALVGGSATVIGPEATVADAAEILVDTAQQIPGR